VTQCNHHTYSKVHRHSFTDDHVVEEKKDLANEEKQIGETVGSSLILKDESEDSEIERLLYGWS